jgi:hypothetical protein
LAAAASVQSSSVAFVPDLPMQRAYKRVGSQPQLVQSKFWTPHGTDHFLGTAQAAKGSSSIFIRNATALIQMGDWCESACADRQPNQ